MARASNRPPFRVQTITPYGLQYFREVLIGARRYGFDSGRLQFIDRWLEHELNGGLAPLIRRDGVQGLIACIGNQHEEAKYRNLGIPVVNISNSLLKPGIPVVTQDDYSVGRLAARHLRLCGCQSFAFWGQPLASYSEQRLVGFRAELREVGMEDRLSVNGGTAVGRLHSIRMYKEMVRWIASLRRPLGIFGVLDSMALQMIRAARENGLRVPEDVAVLGAGDDDFHVEFESVPLSSVMLPAREIGREAAVLLDRMISRRKLAADDIHLPVSEIARRKSTDVLYVSDASIARAVHYIREHAAGEIYLGDVVRAAGVCRTVLQRRFREELGRSILAEIQRVRIGLAQSLLARTDLPMALIAERCGFSNSQRLSMLFRRATGFSPSRYRRQFQTS